MRTQNDREVKRLAKHERIRKRTTGTVERPRLCVHRSLKNFYAQVIDDTTGKVIFGLSTRNKDVASSLNGCGNIAAAARLGKIFAEQAKTKGVSKVCFDRGGYKYHGRVKAFADAAREGGLDF
ncbi:MAG TPA: 50S ribosomal protein L18 [Candidatus Omnitrophota bacterium]|jgi:large subunit ribosomal protein L18|nr:50S ribosomal protein L18 [Candidatus Omnitrophota bacterium]